MGHDETKELAKCDTKHTFERFKCMLYMQHLKEMRCKSDKWYEWHDERVVRSSRNVRVIWAKS